MAAGDGTDHPLDRDGVCGCDRDGRARSRRLPYGVDRHWLVRAYPFIVAIAFGFSILIGAIYELFRIHAGPVVDTVKVAARLQAHCEEAGRPLLMSGELVCLLPEGTDVLVEPLGPTELRGRAAPIEVFAVARRWSGGSWNRSRTIPVRHVQEFPLA